MYYCTFYDMPFGGAGSWTNDQTSGTRARFYDANYNVIYTTAPAYSYLWYANWTPVFHVKPC